MIVGRSGNVSLEMLPYAIVYVRITRAVASAISHGHLGSESPTDNTKAIAICSDVCELQ